MGATKRKATGHHHPPLQERRHEREAILSLFDGGRMSTVLNLAGSTFELAAPGGSDLIGAVEGRGFEAGEQLVDELDAFVDRPRPAASGADLTVYQNPA